MFEDLADRGHAAIELAVGIGLLMIPTALVVLGFGPWSERAVLAEAVAAEASRGAVLALDVSVGNGIGAEMAANYGLASDNLRIGWCGSEPTAGGAGGCTFARGGDVDVAVEVWVPLVNTPWGAIGGLWVHRSHIEQVDLYRSLP